MTLRSLLLVRLFRLFRLGVWVQSTRRMGFGPRDPCAHPLRFRKPDAAGTRFESLDNDDLDARSPKKFTQDYSTFQNVLRFNAAIIKSTSELVS